MDRVIVYTNQVPYEADVLKSNLYPYLGISKIAAGILGEGNFLNGFNCAPTTPASLAVDVAAGEVYQVGVIDATAYSVIPADTTHQILHQGIILDKTTLNTPAPVNSGNSINYLVQIRYQSNDTDSVSRPYFNSADPQNPIFQTNFGRRQDQAVVQVKAGVEAPTGTQVTPSPDSGFIGAWVVTVDFGQTQVLAADITKYAGAPFIEEKLGAKISQATGDARYAQLAVQNNFTLPQKIPSLEAALTMSSTQTINAATTAKLNFDTNNYNPFSLTDTTNKRITPNIAGRWEVKAGIRFTPNANHNNSFAMYVYKNGSFLEELVQLDVSAGASGGNGMNYAGALNFSANVTTDYFEIFVENFDVSIGVVVSAGNLFQMKFLGT